MNKTSNKLSDIGELELVDRISNWVPPSNDKIVLGVGDDAAAFRVSADKLALLTSDMLIENIHFDLKYTGAYQLGYKSLAVNLSDIAAMGGIPVYALINIALPSNIGLDFVEDFYKGINALAGEYSVSIIGGDTCSTPDRIMISITVWGGVEADLLLSRKGAQVGDILLVTGVLGESSAGLAILLSDLDRLLYAALINRHIMPAPRYHEARLIAKSKAATSMMDLSDGLASDIKRICKQSQVGADIQLSKLPVSDMLRHVAGQLNRPVYDFAVAGGEDYELLFTIPPDKLADFKSKCATPVSVIGSIKPPEHGIAFIDSKGNNVSFLKGYEHFG